ncbi:MAG: AGE family epimerase/isomerase [Thermodesulfobacteriota bacterium]
MRFASIFPRLIKPWRNLSPTHNKTVQPNPLVSYQLSQQDLIQIKENLERILTKNIIPFWYPQVVDLDFGGYLLNHDLEGNLKCRADKCIVTQARTVWFFSRLARTEYGTTEHLKAAAHGYKFLREQMWDKQFGGFYWEVDSSGEIATKPDKHLYGQAFGLYALSEYAMVTGESSAKGLAQELFNLLEYNAHDSRYGGYLESFRRDWNLVPADKTSYMNTTSVIKLMNTHIHLMEAIMMYYLIIKDQIAMERLIELIFVLSNTVVRKTVGACTDKYQHNWIPLFKPGYDRVSYGHDLENIWMLIEACNTAGIPNSLLLDLYRTLFNYALQYGFDRKEGGFFESGPLNAPANKKDKIWWVQAECLVSALQMYSLTRDEVYFNCFYQTLGWIVKHQADWEHGDWYAQVAENGKPSGDKAGAWKSPFHNGRAMIKCLELLTPLT